MEPTREERVVIVGSGPAGLRAAEVLSGVGLRPILIDAGSAPGGRVRRLGRQGQARLGDRSVSLQRGFAGLAEKIEFRPETIATGIENGCLGVRRGEAVETLPFDALILATGASELLLPFPGWSRDGVATMSHALAALSRGRPVGRRPVFLGTGPMLYRAAARHAAAGTAPAAVLDTGPAGAGARALPRIATDWIQFGELVADAAALKTRRIAMRRGVRPLAVVGEGAIEALHCRDAADEEFAVPADSLVVGFGWRPEDRLAAMAGAEFDFDDDLGGWRVRTEDSGGIEGEPVYLAGAARGQGSMVSVAEASGTIAAFAALIDLGYPVTVGTLRFWMTRIETRRAFHRGLADAFPPPLDIAATAPDETLACPCRDIVTGRLRRLAADGAPDLRAVWSATGLAGGECGGICCGPGAASILAAALDRPMATLGRLASPTPISADNVEAD